MKEDNSVEDNSVEEDQSVKEDKSVEQDSSVEGNIKQYPEVEAVAEKLNVLKSSSELVPLPKSESESESELSEVQSTSSLSRSSSDSMLQSDLDETTGNIINYSVGETLKFNIKCSF